MPSDVTYQCTDCGLENEIEGPPIKLRTCPECGGQFVSTDTGQEAGNA